MWYLITVGLFPAGAAYLYRLRLISRNGTPSNRPTLWSSLNFCFLCLQALVSTYSRKFLEAMCSPVQKVGSDRFVLPYYCKGRWWKPIIRHKINVSNIVDIEPIGQATSVASEVRPYLGPNEDLYGQDATPNELGYVDGLAFTLIDHTGRMDRLLVGKDESLLEALSQIKKLCTFDGKNETKFADLIA